MEQGPQPQKDGGLDAIQERLFAAASEFVRRGFLVAPIDQEGRAEYGWDATRLPSPDDLHACWAPGGERAARNYQLGAVLGAISGVVVIQLTDGELCALDSIQEIPATPMSKANGSNYLWFSAPERLIPTVGAEEWGLPGRLLGHGETVPLPPSALLTRDHDSFREDDVLWADGRSLDDLEPAPLPAWATAPLVERPDRWEPRLLSFLSADSATALADSAPCCQKAAQFGIYNAEEDPFGSEMHPVVRAHYIMLAATLLEAGVERSELEALLDHSIGDEYDFSGAGILTDLDPDPAKRPTWTCLGIRDEIKTGLRECWLKDKCSKDNCSFYQENEEHIERVYRLGGGTCFHFIDERFDKKTGVLTYVPDVFPIPREFEHRELVGPYGEKTDYWEDQSKLGLWQDYGTAMRSVWGGLPRTKRLRGIDLLTMYYSDAPVLSEPTFSNCMILSGETWEFTGNRPAQGRRLLEDEERLNEVRRVWHELPPKMRTMWAVCAVNAVRFWLMRPGDPKVSIIPHILYIGDHGTGKTLHTMRSLHFWAGAAGSDSDVKGTGVRLFDLITRAPCATAPIFIDDPRKIGDAPSAILKVVGTSPFQDFTRGTLDRGMLHNFIANCFIIASNGLRVFDSATRDRLLIVKIDAHLSARSFAEIYGNCEEGAMLALVALAINERWDEIEALWYWERPTDTRYYDVLRLLEFGVRLIDLSLGLDPTTGPASEQGVALPIPPEKMVEEVASMEDQDVAVAIKRLFETQIITTGEHTRRLMLASAHIENLIPESEKRRLEGMGILPGNSQGGLLGIRVDNRWTQGERLQGLRAVRTYLANNGVYSRISSYKKRRRIFIPLPEEEKDEDGLSPTARFDLDELSAQEQCVIGCFVSEDEFDLSERRLEDLSGLTADALTNTIDALARKGIIVKTPTDEWRCVVDNTR